MGSIGWLACLLTLMSVPLLGACGGVFPDDQTHADAAMRNVQQRVAFDLGCNDAKLVRLGDVARLGSR